MERVGEQGEGRREKGEGQGERLVEGERGGEGSREGRRKKRKK